MTACLRYFPFLALAAIIAGCSPRPEPVAPQPVPVSQGPAPVAPQSAPVLPPSYPSLAGPVMQPGTASINLVQGR